jgi:tRNA pseudouridine55 synthase
MEKLLPSCPQQNGILVLNKPKGPSSAACLGAIKRRLGQKKIGHAGTLDPMASGVLLVLLGQATKLSGHLMAGGEKKYAATVRLGQSTDTWDAEGTLLREADASFVTDAMVEDILASWIGDLPQEVPPYSAAKHEGKPLYALARKGVATPVKTRTVHISRVELEWVRLPHLHFRVSCGSGTYIRSLAHSLGIRLGCGAVLTELTREHSHPFSLAQAHNLDVVLEQTEGFTERVVPLTEALPSWPRVQLNPEQAALARNGATLPFQDLPGHAPAVAGEKAFLLEPEGAPLALAESVVEAGKSGWTVLRGLWN